ncbi:Tetratricopeptide repeat-containing protein OS=Streptomyces microflavus OX=1919 GN=Smic_22870 PE=4 SV=1 [Streptomyces microflavus]
MDPSRRSVLGVALFSVALTVPGRPDVVGRMEAAVVPLLRTSGPEDVRKSMTSAASDLCCLTGYMAVDEGLHGRAQRYYLQALEPAGASEDHLAFCTTLRGMSVQAVDLGQGPVAMRLADAAAVPSPQAGPRMRAFLAGQQADAQALYERARETVRPELIPA